VRIASTNDKQIDEKREPTQSQIDDPNKIK